MTYIIHYKNNEPTEDGKENIINLEYTVYTVEDKNKWFDIIQKSYGNYGEVTVEEIDEEKPLTDREKLESVEAQIAYTAMMTETEVK